ncbi:malonyl-CoA decarboxylase [Ramlibacter humi]|uniref:Malonyl-CoA decarboxylase n=1 Tax=Ramlibacter humi TaxID=2530451 RepID=A0A4Z0CBQ6_9BURK|nr:malonyl-CoA decarboxylase [Ramlibacter humi]TFZ07858.1 malonyl-CoA decarboxylase [Ramlibacter humi]
MSAGEWLTRGVSMLRNASEPRAVEASAAVEERAPRSTRERLKATLRRNQEALSPRVLRRTLAELQAVVDPRVSEVEGARRAHEFALGYAKASPEERRDSWLLMSEQFAPDASHVKAAREKYETAIGTPEEAHAEVRLRRALVSPRARLLQRFAGFPEGMRFLVDLRAELLPHLKSDRRLLSLDAELEHLFSTWFDVAFLELRRISWDSPASLVEKLIKYEAVHDIRSWADVKNRLDSDRRCYGFFHPRLEGEPLIFVEVAFTDGIAGSITPLLDETGPPADLARAATAIFYSISNTQAGLKGVSFGDSLIKRVVEQLKSELPKLKVFATLSPIPGLRSWMAKHAPPELMSALDDPLSLGPKSPHRVQLLSWAARYLGQELDNGRPIDPVARFHLGNGARVEKLNWGADPSPKGLKQSFGLMVNYLYDIKRLDRHRAQLAQGQIPISGAIEDLYG